MLWLGLFSGFMGLESREGLQSLTIQDVGIGWGGAHVQDVGIGRWPPHVQYNRNLTPNS